MKTRRCFSIVPLFADNAVYFPSRTFARPRNKYYCACFPPPSAYDKKICRVTYLFSSVLRKNFEKRSKKVVQKLEFEKKCVILHPLSREKRSKALTE